MKDPKENLPNATIQLDAGALADVQLVSDGDGSPPARSHRVGPPPLPPGDGVVSGSSKSAPSAAGATKKPRVALYVGIFVVMVVIAVGGGSVIGAALRAPAPVVVVTAPAVLPATTTAAASETASASEPGVLRLPTIELNDLDASK